MTSKEVKINELYNRIFGDKISSLNYNSSPNEITKETDPIDKCLDCGNNCNSYKFRQDLPYFQSFDNIDTFVIAEAPGSGIEKGKIGYVFGWENFNNERSTRLNITKYENYFFKILNLNRNETYITDALKCYTPSNEFNSVFLNCKNYLKEEIEILRPKNILVISKKQSLKKFLVELNKSIPFKLKIIPHPSPQNFSKIKTVSDIFISLGSINKNEKWEKLGKQLGEEYENLKNDLKKR